jgi:hypothetical protein
VAERAAAPLLTQGGWVNSKAHPRAGVFRLKEKNYFSKWQTDVKTIIHHTCVRLSTSSACNNFFMKGKFLFMSCPINKFSEEKYL